MAEVVWTEPALSDLDAIADYIALDNPRAYPQHETTTSFLRHLA